MHVSEEDVQPEATVNPEGTDQACTITTGATGSGDREQCTGDTVSVDRCRRGSNGDHQDGLTVTLAELEVAVPPFESVTVTETE